MKKLKNIVMKVIKFFALWILSMIVIYAIEDYIIKLNIADDMAIGISILTYPIIRLLILIIKNINQYRKGEEIQLSVIYMLILNTAVGNNIQTDGILKTYRSIYNAKAQSEVVDIMNELNSSTKNLIFNILLYIITIMAIILFQFEQFTIIVLMYGGLILTYIFSNIGKFVKIFKYEMQVIKESQGEKVFRLSIIISIIIMFLIFVMPILVIMGIESIKIYFSPKEKLKRQLNELQMNREINVVDDNYQENEIKDSDKKYIEEMLEKELGDKIVYHIVNVEENQKNEQGERYNKITVVANLENDHGDCYSYDAIFHKYLTESKLHKKGKIEMNMIWQTNSVKKQDWYSRQGE